MISDLDIYRAANLVIKRHGGDAVTEAARMVDRMLHSTGRMDACCSLGALLRAIGVSVRIICAELRCRLRLRS